MIRQDLAKTLEKSSYWWLFPLLLVVYLPGLFVPLMDNDSAHHANIALKMYLDNNYAFLIDQERPYLDKPHLLFWTAAFSYHIFGVNDFAYKFPSFLFSILGIYSTYRLGSLLYSPAAGRLAALILATAFAFVLAANDVRMDAILTASAIFALWQLCAYVHSKKLLNLVLAALGLALGFATKGWVGAVVPAFALFLYLLYRRDWRMLFHWKWLLLILLFFVFISPVLYSYYLQYDLHPELEVRGRKQVSGVKFILWEQNFERMQGESFRTNKRNFTFFFHSFLWAFLPWSFLYIVAFVQRTRALIRTRFQYRPELELMTIGAALVFMLLFSLSKFKLPHYLNILFPLFALLLAGYLHQSGNDAKMSKLHWLVQVFTLTLMALVGILVNTWIFPFQEVWVVVVSGLLLLLWLSTLTIRQNRIKKTICWSVTGSVFMLFMLNANFYPQLLTYQAGTMLARVAAEKNIASDSTFIYQMDRSFSYDFNTVALHKTITLAAIQELKQQRQALWVITDDEGLQSLQKSGIPILQQLRARDYPVSKLKWKFLNPRTRPEAISYLYLLHL